MTKTRSSAIRGSPVAMFQAVAFAVASANRHPAANSAAHYTSQQNTDGSGS